jgi:hypothetical protein
LLAIVAAASSIGQGAYQIIQAAGSALTMRAILNFPSNMTCADDPTNHRTNCTPSGGGGSSYYQTIQVAKTPVTQEPVLNFPSNMSCVDDPSNTSTDCTPSGGGGGATYTPPYIVSGSSYYGPIFSISPPTASFTGDNCSGVAFDVTYGYPYLSSGAVTGICVEYQTAPTPPYMIKALIGHDTSGIQPGVSGAGNQAGFGIAFRDGTGKIIAFYLYGNTNTYTQMLLEKWTNSGAFSGSYPSYAPSVALGLNDLLYRNPAWWAMSDDGTTYLTWYWSIDGNHWKQYYQVSRTDFFGSGPTQVGIITRSLSTTHLELWVPGWNN